VPTQNDSLRECQLVDDIWARDRNFAHEYYNEHLRVESMQDGNSAPDAEQEATDQQTADQQTADQGAADQETVERRAFLGTSTSLVMCGGLAASYGTLAFQVGRFLYPTHAGQGIWQFVCTLDQLAVGESLPFTMPSGAKVVVARQSADDTADSFVALSSICPHLGCQVHWEGVNERFFCPCHNGAFDASGNATLGPPAKANQRLTRFPLQVSGNLLMIEVPLDAITVSSSEGSA